VLAGGKRTFQPRNCRRLRSHALRDLRLSQTSLLPRFQKSVKQDSLFPFDSSNLRAHTWPSKELLDYLIMGSHV